MTDLAKMTGIIGGKLASACVVAVSSKLPYSGFNRAPNAPELINHGAEFEDGIYFDHTQANYLDCGYSPRYEMDEFAIFFTVKTTYSANQIVMGRDAGKSIYLTIDSGGILNFFTGGVARSSGFVRDGKTHYCTCLLRKNGEKIVIIDKEIARNTTGAVSPDTSPLHIGNTPFITSYFEGMMDDVFIFNKGLSNEQVIAIQKLLGA